MNGFVRQRFVALWSAALGCCLFAYTARCETTATLEGAAQVQTAPASAFDQAKTLYDSGQFAQARAAFLSLAQADPYAPRSVDSQYYALQCLISAQDQDAFTIEAEAFLKAHPADSRVSAILFDLGAVARNKKDWNAAIARFDRIINEHASSDPALTLAARFERAGCLFENQQYAALITGVDALEHDARQDPRIPDLAFKRAIAAHRIWKALIRQAPDLRKAGQMEQADAKEQQGRQLIQAFRTKADDLLSSGSKITDARRRELELIYLESYMYEANYAGLTRAGAQYAANHAADRQRWAQGKYWEAVGRAQQTPCDLTGAAAALEEIINEGLRDPDLQNHLPTYAAYWRIYVAKEQGDTAEARRWAAKLRDEMPDGPVKTKAVSRFKDLME